MLVRVRLFAMLRERTGRDSIELQLAQGATVADALAALSQREPLGELVRRLPLRMAVNRDYAAADTTLRDGDELALIPPVSGGAAAQPYVLVSGEPLSAERVTAAVADPRAGAIVCFQGVTREVESLSYEAYAEMAAERIERILAEVLAAPGICRAAAEHRVGEVALGHPSVLVAVSAAHRGEAFAGAREAIDRIKAEAPIWKREGTRWVEGTVPEA
jgi:molybdopterin synthase catalytic subunit